MKIPFYKKLKTYMFEQKGDEEHCSCKHMLFGDLMSTDCCFNYQDDDGNWQDWFGQGAYSGAMDFLLDYYVVGIVPKYKIKQDKIIPYLYICLAKENKDE